MDFLIKNEVHPGSAYRLVKKVFHPSMIRGATQVRPYKNSLTLALSPRERGFGG